MRCWNVWGDEQDREELGGEFLAFLRERIAAGRPRQDLSLAQALAALPPPRLSASTRFSQDPKLRLRHAHGRSFAGYLALRSGEPGPVAEAVAQPRTYEKACQALAEARSQKPEARSLGAIVIPYGGGTCVDGQLQLLRGERPVLNISLARMNLLLGTDERAQLARFGAGTQGPQIEAQLRGYPQAAEPDQTAQPARGNDALGRQLLRAAAAALDPGQMMNPGKLF